MLRPIYIYRGTLTEGGCSKIIKDLIRVLAKTNKYDIHLVTFVNTNYDIGSFDFDTESKVTHISMPEDPWWMKHSVNVLRDRVSNHKDPVLISFLDYNSNRFLAMCSAFFINENLKWINFNTNHPKIISNWFSRKNSATGISEDVFFESVDHIRLENKNFKQYMPENCQDKCVDFLNTVSIPKLKKTNFKTGLNLISVNGLREWRKSIIPFVEKIALVFPEDFDFKLYIIGETNISLKKELEIIILNNPFLKKRIKVLPVVDNIHDYYNSCDLMVTTASFEGTSNAVLESFCHNIPVLCLKDALGLNETVKHGTNGFLCLDARDMASRVLELSENKKEFNKLKDGCDLIKPYIIDPELGIKKYLTLIESKESKHNIDSRLKLKSYSEKFLSAPYIYREKLEALIIYIDTCKVDLNVIRRALSSEARRESRKTFFICRYKEGKDLKLFLEFLKDYDDCEILYKYNRTPSSISNYISSGCGAEGLVCLSEIKSIKQRLIGSGYDVICYYDSNCNATYMLENPTQYLSELSSWKNKDHWVWMIGSSLQTLNSCYFNYEPWTQYDINNFINTSRSQMDPYISSCGRISSPISLPQELMKKIRRIY